MLKRSRLLFAMLLLMAVQPVMADPPPILRQVPADYQLVIVVRSFVDLNAKAGAIAKALNKPDRLPADLAVLLAEQRGLNFDEVDRAKAVLILIPALPTEEQTEMKGALLLPMKDFKKFTTDNKMEAKGGQNIITAAGTPLVTSQVGDYALLADDVKIGEQIAKPAKPLLDALTAEQKELLGTAEVSVHVNFAPVFAVLRAKLEKELATPGEQNAMRAVMDLVAAVGKDTDAVDVGLVLGADGIELRGLLTAKDGSQMAKAFAGAAKGSGGLVTGVPLTNFLAVGGGIATLSPDSDFAQGLYGLSKKMLGAMTGDAESAGRLMELRQKLDKLITKASVAVTTGKADGKPGLPLGMVVVAQTSDGASAKAAARAYLKELSKMKLPTTSPDAAGFQYTEDAETVAGVKVDKMVGKIEALVPGLGDATAIMPKLFGEDQMVFRVAAKGQSLVIVLGGGTAAVEDALKAVDAKTDAESLPGVAKVKAHLVPDASFVVYIAVDRLVNTVFGVLASVAGITLPEFPKAEEPIAISGAVKDRSASGRLFVPISVMQATVKFIDSTKKEEPGGASGAAPKPPTF
ncbi:MAG: hypothetical protein PHU85_05035 [Phycisphaerae bacterium]|nr:hypothetical protein [Phycisphaerae bacterium]